MLKRKNRRFGIGVRDDNCVQEVDEGSAGHEAISRRPTASSAPTAALFSPAASRLAP